MVLANKILFFVDINWSRLVLYVYFEDMYLPALRKWLNCHFEYLSHNSQFQPNAPTQARLPNFFLQYTSISTKKNHMALMYGSGGASGCWSLG